MASDQYEQTERLWNETTDSPRRRAWIGEAILTAVLVAAFIVAVLLATTT